MERSYDLEFELQLGADDLTVMVNKESLLIDLSTDNKFMIKAEIRI